MHACIERVKLAVACVGKTDLNLGGMSFDAIVIVTVGLERLLAFENTHDVKKEEDG